MNRSNLIFGCIIAAYVVYISVKGDLPKYLDLFTGDPKPDENISPDGRPTEGTANAPSTIEVSAARTILASKAPSLRDALRTRTGTGASAAYQTDFERRVKSRRIIAADDNNLKEYKVFGVTLFRYR